MLPPSFTIILLSILSISHYTSSSPLSSSLESSPGAHTFSPASLSSPKRDALESTPGTHRFAPAPVWGGGRRRKGPLESRADLLETLEVREAALEGTPGVHKFAPAPVWGSRRRKGPLEQRSAALENTPGVHKIKPAPVWGSTRRKGPLESRATSLESTPGTHKFKPAPVWGTHRGKSVGRMIASRQFPHGIGSPIVGGGGGGAAAAAGGGGGDGSVAWKEGGETGLQSMPHGMVVGGNVENGRTIATPLSNTTLTCSVGGTRTSLFITLIPASSLSPNALTSEAFNITLSSLTAYTSAMVESGFDEPLANIFQDPFMYTVHKGAVLHAKSTEGDQLTWGVLGSAVRGLGECLAGRFEVRLEKVEWMVKDSNWGVVGEGDVGFEEV